MGTEKICPLCLGWLLDSIKFPLYQKCIGCGYTIRSKKMNITLKELNPHNYSTNEIIDKNLAILFNKINQVRDAYDLPMIITSGLRSNEQQQELIKSGKSNATKSHHLNGEAVDILDKDGSLRKWIEDNITLMIQIGFWFEDFNHTHGWVHFQIVPPISGRRIFIP